MASSRYDSFVNFLIFFMLLQENIPTNGADSQCLNPKFDANKKIVVDYYYRNDSDTFWPDDDLCKIINGSDGKISINYHMCSDMKDQNNCVLVDSCIKNRELACQYKNHPQVYNDCNKSLPDLDVQIADCVCSVDADNILTSNEAALRSYGVQKTPTLIVDGKYDPCFNDYCFDSMKTYFCNAYNNALSICK